MKIPKIEIKLIVKQATSTDSLYRVHCSDIGGIFGWGSTEQEALKNARITAHMLIRSKTKFVVSRKS